MLKAKKNKSVHITVFGKFAQETDVISLFMENLFGFGNLEIFFSFCQWIITISNFILALKK